MSISLLIRALGVPYGCEDKRIQYYADRVVFTIQKPFEKYSCSACGTTNILNVRFSELSCY